MLTRLWVSAFNTELQSSSGPRETQHSRNVFQILTLLCRRTAFINFE